MEKLCEARAIDEAKKKKQIEEARAKVTTFQAKDRAAYLAHMGIKESQDYSTFLECGEHGLADRGLNTLKDLECLQLNRWENHLIKLRQFCTAFAIDPTYEADEYKAFLPQLTLELYKKGGGIFVAEADRQVRDAMMSLSSAPEHATEALRVIEKLDKIRQRAELKAYIHQPDCVLVWRNMRGREGQKATLSSFQDMFQLERSDLYHLQSKQRDLF